MPDGSYPELIVAELSGLGEAGSFSLVKDWIGQAEDLYLDFKQKEDPTTGVPSVGDKRVLAKALSGFGNSDGGLLVWGIEAAKDKNKPDSPDVAKALKPISSIRAFHADLNSLIRLATKPVLPGVLNFRVLEDSTRDFGYVVTHVPAGPHPPYGAELDNNNHYYKRSGSSFYPMEPFDIRDVVFRQNYPKIDCRLQRIDFDLKSGRHVYLLGVALKNWGPSSLRTFRIRIWIPEAILGKTEGHFGKEQERVGGVDYIVLSRNFPHPVYGSLNLFPGDETVLFTQEGGIGQILYVMDTATFISPVRNGVIKYELAGENMPPLRGEVPIADLICF